MTSQPVAETEPRALVHMQQERYGRDSRGIHHNCLEERRYVIKIGCDFVSHVTHRRGFSINLFLVYLLFSSLSEPIVV